MQFQSLSNKNNIDISLYFSVLNENIYRDNRFLELLSMIKENTQSLSYACYTESSYLKENIYIPVFHTLYLASKHHNVVLNEKNDSWLIDIFPNNTYYIIQEGGGDLSNKIKTIKSLKEIGVQ